MGKETYAPAPLIKGAVRPYNAGEGEAWPRAILNSRSFVISSDNRLLPGGIQYGAQLLR